MKKFNVYSLTAQAGAPNLDPDQCIILVDIPDSEDVPHQSTRDQKYYARVGGKSRPIGHRLVTDMFHRERHARFELGFEFTSKTFIPQYMLSTALDDTRPAREVKLSIGAVNKGKVYAKYVSLFLWVPELLVSADDRKNYTPCEIAGARYYVDELDNTRCDITGVDSMGLIRSGGPARYEPVLPGLYRSWEFECVSHIRPSDFKDEKIRWRLHCDNAPVQSGEMALRDIKFDVQDKHAFEELGPPFPRPPLQ